MKKVLCILLSFAMAFLLGSSSAVLAIDDEVTANADAQIQETQVEFADDRVLVVLNNSASISSKNYTTADFSNIGCAEVKNLMQASSDMVQAKLSGVSIASMSEIPESERFACMDEVNTETFQKILCLKLEEPGKENVLKAIEQLKKRPDVVSAEPDYVISLASDPIIPNDPYYGHQWAPAKISLPQAWNITTGNATVRIGVLDTGIDGSQPDLQNRILASSRDFTSGSAVVGGLTDPEGHGTHVAGIIAASGNNGDGTSGVGWSFSLVSLRILDQEGSGKSSNAVLAIDYAQSCKIPVLNMSVRWGSDPETYNESMRAAIANYSGVFVCASGNEKKDIETTHFYPASYDLSNIIVVGATSKNDEKYSKSNYGKKSVDLFAPGEDILSCYPTGKCADGTHGPGHYQYGLHYKSGTSMAAPYVAGVAALILAKHPNLPPETIKQWILNGVDKVSALSDYCVTGGRLNAYKATNNHAYTYTDYGNATTHKCTCSCGYIVYESHDWQSMSVIDSINDSDSTEAIVTQFCGKCGRRR